MDSHDLYGEHFQPILENDEILRRFSLDDTFVRHTRELRDATGIVLVYPDWWGMPPAMMKGWIDRIFRPGIAYEYEGGDFTEKVKRPLLKGKKVLLVTTTNETNPLSQEAMSSIWRDRIFGYVGITDVTLRVLYGLRESTGLQRREWLSELEELAHRWL